MSCLTSKRRVAVFGATMLFAGCNLTDPPPFDPRGLQTTERNSAVAYPAEPKRPLPTTLQSQFIVDRSGKVLAPTTAPTTGPALELQPQTRLSLQEAIHRAVANNLDVKVAGYGPAIEGTRVVEAEARFDPTFFTNFQFESRDSQQAFSTVTSSDNVDQQQIYTLQTGLRQNLDYGGQAELRYQTVNTDVLNNAFNQVNPNPFWDNLLVLQLTQPLLQNFGADVNRARITIGRNNQRISLLDFRKQLEQTVRDIEFTYWQLVQAERVVRIDEKLLDETLKTAEVLFKRREQDVT
ncbi:MAG: TolC family protein, partial [Tepidisphaeraceae bacterium]